MERDAASPGTRKKGLLRFLTCGSVDDGKSTLIGRLLYDAKLIFEDQLAAVTRDSRTHGTTGEDIDLALLVDGLEIERQQGITIDVAYRYFTTDRRSFIVADTPGHEQYTRNMATGASNSDLAVILIDARKGVLVQTKRHSYICALLGIRHVVLAINKIDLVEFSESIFRDIEASYRAFAGGLGFQSITAIPISARYGENVMAKSAKTGWYVGPTLIAALEDADVEASRDGAPFRFPVQRVARPNLDFRGFAGTIAAGRIAKGEPIVSAVSGKGSRVERIVTADGDLDQAAAGEAVTLVLADEIDIARGDVLSGPDHRPEVSDQFAAHLLWMSEDAMLPGRSYQMRIGMRWTIASITAIKHRVDVNSMQELAARTLVLNDIAVCNLATATPVAFDAYKACKETGAFILVDRTTNETVAAGMIDFGLRRATNIHVESLIVDKAARANLKGQRPTVLWFTGLSGSGKSTLSKRLEKRLFDAGKHTYVLDGDNVRHGINRDLGFTAADRVENIRRIGEVAKLFSDAGLIVLCSFISPFRAERDMVRDMVGEGEFVEIFVDAPIEECARRDPKGLYAKAMRGEIKNFTGIDSPYEPPLTPDLHLDTAGSDPDSLIERIMVYLRDAGRL
ncbi:MAG: sulfate adenylyltransferase subunit CysN [Hyphomicrobium sp.]|nr:sulfate adenylyltransferase subunit CysN [Hyphomicrobium sp.]